MPRKSQTTKELLVFYKSKKYTTLKNIKKFNKLNDLEEFYRDVSLDYDILNEIPNKYLISVIQDYVLIKTKQEKLGDTFIFDGFDKLFQMVYLLDDLFFTMRIGGIRLYYSTIFCYHMEKTEEYLYEIGETDFLEHFRAINDLSSANRLSKDHIINRLEQDKPIVDISRMKIDRQDAIFDHQRVLTRLSEQSEKNLEKYVMHYMKKNRSIA